MIYFHSASWNLKIIIIDALGDRLKMLTEYFVNNYLKESNHVQFMTSISKQAGHRGSSFWGDTFKIIVPSLMMQENAFHDGASLQAMRLFHLTRLEQNPRV